MFNPTVLTDTSLIPLTRLKTLRHLWMHGAALSDDALAPIADFESLEVLDVRTIPGGDGLCSRLKRLPKLKRVGFPFTGVTDAGLKHLAEVKTLTRVDVTDSKVTPAGLRALQKALPNCEITPAPLKDPPERKFDQAAERRAVEWALKNNAIKLLVAPPDRDEPRQVTKTEDLPAVFRVHTLIFHGNLAVTDEALAAHLPHLSGLECLDIPGSPNVTDAGLAAALAGSPRLRRFVVHTKDPPRIGDRTGQILTTLSTLRCVHLSAPGLTLDTLRALARLPELNELELLDVSADPAWIEALAAARGLESLGFFRGLHADRFTPSALAPLAKLKGFKQFWSHGSPLPDEVLAPLAAVQSLERLSLRGIPGGDALCAQLKHLPALRDLDLGSSGLTDVGLEHLREIKTLTRVDVTGSKITPAGLRALKKALPACEIRPAPPDE